MGVVFFLVLPQHVLIHNRLFTFVFKYKHLFDRKSKDRVPAVLDNYGG